MSGIVEVHEKMLAQLQQRNVQLQQEKAEVELRLRQAMALLSELQSIWMDLPPKLADSIAKVLSSVGHKNEKGNMASNTPRRQVSGESPDKKEPKLNQEATTSGAAQPGWFSFNMTEMFGCTTPRHGGGTSVIAPQAGSALPQIPEKRSPPAPMKQCEIPEEVGGNQGSAWEPEPSSPANGGTPSSGSSPRFGDGDEESPECSANTKDSPRFGGKTSPKNSMKPNRRHTYSGERPLMPDIPICQTICMDENTCGEHNENENSGSLAENMVDLLTDVPGATTLIAEIDVLCNALQKEATHAHRQLEQRIESLKTEARQHRQNIEESYLNTTAAQHEELELCKAKLNEQLMEIMPSSNMGGEMDPQLCDAEWAGLRRVADQRARAGQAHADWLEEYFSQRVSATEAFRDQIKTDFFSDLESIWQRKAVLQARFRARLSVAGEEARLAGCTIEIASLRKDLQALNRETVAPLQALADSNGRIEKEEAARLKTILNDAKTQCKSATHQLDNFLEESKADIAGMKSSQNAEIFAHAHLRQRSFLMVAFRGWLEDFLRLRLASKQQNFDQKDSEVSVYEGKLDALDKMYTKVQDQLQVTLTSRDATVDFVQLHSSQCKHLILAFSVWVSLWLDHQLSSARQELSTALENACSLRVSLQNAEAAKAGGEKQLQRAHSFVHASAESKRLKQGELVAIFSAWNIKRLESQLQGACDTLDQKNAQCAESVWKLEPLRAAVSFAQRRTGRRATLAVVYCSWATQSLQQISRQFARQEADVRKQTGEKLERLRQTVINLVDDCEADGSTTGSSGVLTPRSRRRLSNSARYARTSLSQRSQVSSICGESPSLSDDEGQVSRQISRSLLSARGSFDKSPR